MPHDNSLGPRTRTGHKRVWMGGMLLVFAGAFLIWQRGNSAEPRDGRGGGQPSGAGRKGDSPRSDKKGDKKGGGGPASVVAVRARTGNIGVYFTGLGTVTPIDTVNVR